MKQETALLLRPSLLPCSVLDSDSEFSDTPDRVTGRSSDQFDKLALKNAFFPRFLCVGSHCVFIELSKENFSIPLGGPAGHFGYYYLGHKDPDSFKVS